MPEIPNIEHWFQPHVLRQISALRWHIDDFLDTKQAREIAECAFLSCIRGWSNADPVPVSGLEVTRHIMEKRKSGFFPDVRRQYVNVLSRTLASIEDYSRQLESKVFVPMLLASSQGNDRKLLKKIPEFLTGFCTLKRRRFYARDEGRDGVNVYTDNVPSDDRAFDEQCARTAKRVEYSIARFRKGFDQKSRNRRMKFGGIAEKIVREALIIFTKSVSRYLHETQNPPCPHRKD